MTVRILLIDDDDAFRSALAEQLRLLEEFEVVEASNAAEAAIQAGRGRYACVLLDLGLPDAHGRDVCRLLRDQGMRCPIIVLTGHTGDAEAIISLDGGANDFVEKPLRLGVLRARIRAQLRQFEQSEHAAFRVGPYVLEPSTKVLIDEATGNTIDLTDKELAILRFLIRSSGLHVSKETLLEEVWGYSPQVTSHTVETHIYRLRQKIETDPSNPKILIREKDGYRLVR